MAAPEVRPTKKYPARGAILAVLLGLWGQNVLTQPETTSSRPTPDERFEFRLTTPEVQSERLPDGFSEIHVEGFGTQGLRPGAPSLPLKTYLVAIPPGVQPTLEVRRTGATSHRPGVIPRAVPTKEVKPTAAQGRELILADGSPMERARILSQAARKKYRADPSVYDGDQVFPLELARLGRVGVLRDQRYVEVLVSPVRYDPAIRGLRITESVDLVVHFEGAATQPSGPPRDERFFESIYRETLVNPFQGRRFRLSAYEPRKSTAIGPGREDLGTSKGAAPRQRIVTREDGMVLLDYNRLQWVAGLLGTDVTSWRVTQGGEPVALDIQDDGDGFIEPGESVRFYGQAYDDDPKTVISYDFEEPFIDLYAAGDFTDETTYFLTVETVSHPALETIDGAPAGRTPADFFVDDVRMEVNDAYRPLGSEDPWYWLPTLVTTGENPPTRVLTVEAPGLHDPTLPVEASAQVRGTSSYGTIDPDHLTRFRLKNSAGVELASQEGSFDGRRLFNHQLTWTYGGSGPVATDPLYLELEVVPISGIRNDVIPDFFEVSYRRSFSAIDDTLKFTWPNEDAEFIVGGLSTSDVDIFELTVVPGTSRVTMRRVTGGVVSGTGPFEVRFRIDDDPALAPGATREFLVIGPGRGTVPADPDFRADTVSGLRDPFNQADLIVLAHPDLLDDAPGSVLNQLLDYKASPAGNEITSTIALLQDVYDEFNHGQPGPWAIREFLRWVMSTEPGEGWADPKPSFVMLLGDGSINYKDGPTQGNFVPTQVMFKEDPQLGYYASDNLMAAVVGDDQSPDLVIGRVPSRSVEQVNMVLQKTLDYLANPDETGTWRRRALLVSDRGTSSGEGNLDFEITNARAESLICSSGEATFAAACPGETPFTFKHLRYYTDYYTNPEVLNPAGKMTVDLKACVNGEDGVSNGAVLLQYGGHGNFFVWSGDAFFDQRPPQPPAVVDTEELFNGQRLPWLMAHNCLTGGFHITSPSTMGEDWLHRVGGGAIGVFSPTGLSFNYVGEAVNDIIWKALYGRHKVREIAVPVMSALTFLCAQNSIEPCQHYALLGDPSLRLNLRSVEPASDLTASALGQQVELSWTASPTPGVTYDLYRKRELFNYEKVNSAPLATTHYTDTGLTYATNYLYYVVAVDPEGFESRWSNFNEDCSEGSPDCVVATPLNADPPSVPTGLSVSDPGLGDRLEFRWNPNPEDDLAYYTIFYGFESGNYTAVQDVNLTTLSVTNLPEGQPVYLRVSASNTSAKTSAPTAEVSDFPIFAPGVRPPAYIDGLRVDRVGNDLLLEWDQVALDAYGKPTTVSAYEVFRGGDYRNETLVKIGECAGPCAAFTDPGAADLAGPVQYRVRAVDAFGASGGLGAEYPRGTNLTVNPSASVPGNLQLSWDPVLSTVSGAPASGIHYRLIASDSPLTLDDARAGTFGVLLTTTETSVDIPPEPQSRYYSVLAVDDKGNVSLY